MSRDRKGMLMAGGALALAVILQIGVFVFAGGPDRVSPIAEATNVPTK